VTDAALDGMVQMLIVAPALSGLKISLLNGEGGRALERTSEPSSFVKLLSSVGQLVAPPMPSRVSRRSRGSRGSRGSHGIAPAPEQRDGKARLAARSPFLFGRPA
jgi:hypothetical protein